MSSLRRTVSGPVTMIALWAVFVGLTHGMLPFALMRGLHLADARGTLVLGLVVTVVALVAALWGATGQRAPQGVGWALVSGLRGLVRALGLRRAGLGRLILLGLVAGLVVLVVNVTAGMLIDWQSIAGDPPAAAQDIRRDWTETLSVPGLITLGLLAAPPGEELLYRGGLLLAADGLNRARMPRWLRRVLVGGALVATSTTFGLIHATFSMQNVVTAMVNGLIWGGLALRTRSVIPALLGHGTFNTAVFLAWA